MQTFYLATRVNLSKEIILQLHRWDDTLSICYFGIDTDESWHEPHPFHHDHDRSDNYTCDSHWESDYNLSRENYRDALLTMSLMEK